MPSVEKIKGAISVASNSPGMPTGYGEQVKLLVDRFMRHGIKTAVLSNYGLQGRIDTIRSKHGDIAHYPKGFNPYDDDVVQLWHEHFMHTVGDVPNAIMTLYDVWVYNQLPNPFPHDIISWVPLDHVTLPPKVAQFLERDNVTALTMSPHGQRQMEAAGIKATYIPHAIDTKIFKPTKQIDGVPTREVIGIDDDTFLVTMVSANKANKYVHRKGLAEAIFGYALFSQKNPNTHLYLHMEPSEVYGGFNVPELLLSVGLDLKKVTFADRNQLRVGYPQTTLAALYTASDVLLMPSYGEGFGVPLVEAQACGTKTITSAWTATQDLAGPDSFLVAGQPFWDAPQKAYWHVPFIQSITEALEKAYESERGKSSESIAFAKQFDIEKVWDEKWIPFLKGFFDGAS